MRKPEHWRIGVLDPYGGSAALVEDGLSPLGAKVSRARDLAEVEALARAGPLDLLVIAMCLPAVTHPEALPLAVRAVGSPPVAVLSGCTATDLAARVLFPTAIALLPLPTSSGILRDELVEAMRTASRGRDPVEGIVGASPEMVKVLDRMAEVAATDSTVLLTGETGTGKELVARAIHDLSGRAGGPFVAIDCAGLPNGLLETELFGHARGSFTGAQRDRAGLFEAARGGTVFLDEVADAPEQVQVRLLRVLEEREVRRVGESRNRLLDVRVIAATQRDLGNEVRLARFRKDLYYRVRVFEISLPPLRDRQEDVSLLVAHLLARLEDARPITTAALRSLEHHSWPGNVRELRAVLEVASIRSAGAAAIGLGHLPDDISGEWIRALRARMEREAGEGGEVDALREVLEEVGGSRKEAAVMLGVSRTTLWRMMKRAGL